METLKGLLTRVQAATGPDRDLDAGVMMGVGILTRRDLLAGMDADPLWEYWDAERNAAGRHSSIVPSVTDSLDAAGYLVERIFPDACLEITVGAHKEGRRISTAFIRLGDHDLGECWEAATAPLAICAALLSALIAQAEQDGGSHGA